MCATFTDEDVGKLVERADGTVIGTVASLEDGAARVEPAPDVIDKLLIRFDRAEVGEPFMLDESDVREISAKRVHLSDDFSRERAESASASGAAASGAAAGDQTDAGESAVETETADSNRANGGAGATADSAADSSGALQFETRFQIGAAAVSGISVLLGLLFFWFGYQDSSLLGVGPGLDIITGAVGFMFFMFVAVVAFVMAIYMEPGLDD